MVRSGHRLAGGIYYGWVLVVTLALAQVISWGLLYYSFTVFLGPMHASLGWSRASMTGAFSLALFISGLAGVPAGRWLDRRGARLLMTCGSIAAALLVLLWAAVQSLLMFYLIWAAIGVAMAGVLYEPAFAVVATWFRRKRGRALTVLTFIAGFASVIFLPLSGWLVQAQGWRHALVTLAIILACGTILPHALVLRRRPQDLGLLPDGDMAPAETAARSKPEPSIAVRAALHDATFWWLALAFFLATLSVGVVFVHLVPFLTDEGYSARFAASVTGLIGVMALPGRLILTPLGDRYSRTLVTAIIFLTEIVALVVLLTVHSTTGVFIFVVLFGGGYGAITPARAALVAEYYGSANYASISSMVALCLTGARSLAPVGAGVLYDLTGGYGIVLRGLAVLSGVAVVAVLLAERSARRLVRATAAPAPH